MPYLKQLCRLKWAKKIVLKAAQPIDWLSEDNYSCHGRAGVNLVAASAEKPRI
jgi:hypothetical protein